MEAVTLATPEWLHTYPQTRACLFLMMQGALWEGGGGILGPELQLEYRGRPTYPNGPLDPWEAIAEALDRQCRLRLPVTSFHELPGYEYRGLRGDARPVFRWLGDL